MPLQKKAFFGGSVVACFVHREKSLQPLKCCFLQSPVTSQVSAMGINTLSQFTKPFLSWVATHGMNLIYNLDREVSEGMLVPFLGLKM